MKWTSKGCSAKKCDDVIDVQNSCFAHKTSWLFVVTFSLPYQGTKKCDGVQNSCFSHKTDCLFVCLFVCFLTFSSCCTFARVVTMVTSLQCCRWGEGYVVQRVFSPNREPDIPLISVIFFQSFEREYIQNFWKLMKLAFPIKKFVKYFVHEVHILNFTKRL